MKTVYTKQCRVCKKTKEHKYLMLNSQGRCIYTDELGNLWNGRMCYECKKEQVLHYQHTELGSIKLTSGVCINCACVYKQGTLHQKYCSVKCRNDYKYKVVISITCPEDASKLLEILKLNPTQSLIEAFKKYK